MIVGFYYSDVILDAISKGIISSAIALDMKEVGTLQRQCPGGILLSWDIPVDYYSVGQNVITRGNVGTLQNGGKAIEGKKRKSFCKRIHTDPAQCSDGAGASYLCCASIFLSLNRSMQGWIRIDAVFSSNAAINDLSETLEQGWRERCMSI